MVAGREANLALRADGTVWSWGSNHGWVLGNGLQAHRATPMQVQGLTNIQAIALGHFHALAVDAQGKIWSWGSNTSGQLGIGSVGGATSAPLSFSLPEGRKAIAVAAGEAHSLALDSQWTVWGWGDNQEGQLAQGPAMTGQPFKILGLPSIKVLSTQLHHSLALDAWGNVWAWGRNAEGQVGDGTLAVPSMPRQVLQGATDVRAGWDSSVALKSDGTAWGWGSNYSWKLGFSSTVLQTTPRMLSGLPSLRSIAVGEINTWVVSQSGEVWGVGINWDGELLGDNVNACTAFCKLPLLSSITALAAGPSHVLAWRQDGVLLSWGGNGKGQLGAGRLGHRESPGPVVGLPSNSYTVSAAVGADSSAAVQSDGSVWTWGAGTNRSLGDNTDTSRPVPARLALPKAITEVSAGRQYTLALDVQGGVWMWGWGQAAHAFPFAPDFVGPVTQLSAGREHSLFLASGDVWAWGSNASGQLGSGSGYSHPDQYNTPVRVQGLPPGQVVAIAAGGDHSLALTSDGRVWGWGSNAWGQLGGTVGGNRYTAAPVPGLSGIRAISAGELHSLAVDVWDALWGWGYNAGGVLGNAGADAQPKPVFILSNVKTVSAGRRHSLAQLGDDTVMAWGHRFDGQFPAPASPSWYVPTPVSVGRFSRIATGSSASHSMLIDYGWLSSMGVNPHGELGSGERGYGHLPQRVLLPAASR